MGYRIGSSGGKKSPIASDIYAGNSVNPRGETMPMAKSGKKTKGGKSNQYGSSRTISK